MRGIYPGVTQAPFGFEEVRVLGVQELSLTNTHNRVSVELQLKFERGVSGIPSDTIVLTGTCRAPLVIRYHREFPFVAPGGPDHI